MSKILQLAVFSLALAFVVAMKSADPAPASTFNYAVGDVVMSLLPLSAFRAQHGDSGPQFSYLECTNGTDISNTTLHTVWTATGESLPANINCQERYPRAAVSGVVVAGTTLGESIQDHNHTFTFPTNITGVVTDTSGTPVGTNRFQNAGGAQAAVPGGGDSGTSGAYQVRFNGGQHMTTDAMAAAETRPNSFYVHYYIRVR